jgi:hypothetical protein
MPGISTMIGIGVNRHRSSQYWTQTLINTDCLFYASDNSDLLNKVAATHLPNQVTGAVDFLTVTGTGLNARYRTPDSDTYRTADSDYVFWKSDASESTCDGNRLIAWDFPRILIKSLNVAPYTILAIAILKPGVVVTDGMRTAFDLSKWWDNILSAYGVIKGNRPLAQKYAWTPEVPSTLLNGLVGSWELNETSGNAIDASGNGHTGTPSGVTQQVTGAVFTLAGNSVIDCGAIAGVTVYSVSFFAKRDTIASGYRWIYGVKNTYAGLFLYENGEIDHCEATGNSIAIAAAGTWSDKTAFHHIVMVVSVIGTGSSGKARLYFDGVDKGLLSYITDAPAFLKIGRVTASFDGTIKKFRMWNRAITPTEVIEAGLGKPYPF